jgi:glutamate synthase domain-containing protein 3
LTSNLPEGESEERMARAATNDKTDLKSITIDATGVYYKDLNSQVRGLIDEGYQEIVLQGVNGQRYIGDGLTQAVRIVIDGVPGNDLGAFMDGPTLIVNDNAQDGVGNTMNSGKIVVKGHAGDVLGYGMRGGKIFVLSDVGYRVGIHMKSFKEQVPVIVAGGRAGDFFGEYMAGGVMVLLGMGPADRPLVGSYVGTGMHGGVIFLRGEVSEGQLGKEVQVYALEEEDRCQLEGLLAEFAADTGSDISAFSIDDFVKLQPFSHRPYGNMYCY